MLSRLQIAQAHHHVHTLVHAAIDAADPERAVKRYLSLQGDEIVVDGQRVPLHERSCVKLVAFGKAATAMARGAAVVLGRRVAAGLIVHPESELTSAVSSLHITRMPGGHPLPNENSLRAGRALETLLAHGNPEDVVIVLVSGGGSAMLELPIAAMSIERIAAITSALQKSGADVHELNFVRRTLSRIKGGGLLELAAPARVIGLLLSDVVGDDPSVIASGPILHSKTGTKEALEILDRFGLASAVADVRGFLREPNSSVQQAIVTMVGSNALAARAVQASASSIGFDTRVVTDRLCGEAGEAGRMIAATALQAREEHVPQCLIFGGETTVTVRGSGRGGRNQELALGAACAIDGVEGIVICSFATDGVDGASQAAGAIARGDSVKRAAALGVSAQQALFDNDSATFFAKLGDAIVTGPTGTNVNDLAVALIY